MPEKLIIDTDFAFQNHISSSKSLIDSSKREKTIQWKNCGSWSMHQTSQRRPKGDISFGVSSYSILAFSINNGLTSSIELTTDSFVSMKESPN